MIKAIIIVITIIVIFLLIWQLIICPIFVLAKLFDDGYCTKQELLDDLFPLKGIIRKYKDLK